MATRKSLVYLDDVIQRALKDVLIPILGYRDTSKDLGQYTDLIEYLRKDVSALQVKDKGKLYIHNDMSQPINIYIPETKYGSDYESSVEPIDVIVEFRSYNDPLEGDSARSSSLLAATITIPGGYTNNGQELRPYCKSCNKMAVDVLKNAYVKVLSDDAKKPSKIIQVYFPAVNAGTSSNFGRGVITVYSQHRDCEKVTSWDGVIGNEEGVSVITQHEVILGTTPYFEDIPNRDKLVRSNTIKEIEGVTSAVYTYLDEANQTVPTTLYHERQDDRTRVTGTLTFKSAEEVKTRKAILMDIFGTDWSEVDVQFTDDVTDISDAFAGYTFTTTPRSVRGKNVVTANGLFANSSVQHITDQAELLKDLPRLEYFNRGFENTPLADAIEEKLFVANNRLLSIHYCFKNTKITNTHDFWNMTHMYLPDRDPSTSSLIPDPGEILVRLEGIACFEGVTTLPTEVINAIPEVWKKDIKSYSYMSMEEFYAKREALFKQYEYDLSQVTITIEGDNPDITGLFENTPIIKAPKEINALGATSMDNMFNNCNELRELYSSTVAKLINVTSAVLFTSGCSKLTTYPQDIFVPLKKITSYQDAMSYLTAMTGPMPTVNGKQLWELQGTPGYPSMISGYNCYSNSTFDNVDLAPELWRGISA